jgi:pyruvate kinase
MRRTKIVCTIGPRTDSPAMLEQLLAAGMNVARLNMSHAAHDWTRAVVKKLRAISKRLNRPCAIMLDTQGPSIRTGELREPLPLAAGDILEFTVRGARPAEKKSVSVDYNHLARDLQRGDTVLIDNGVLRLKVLEKSRNRIRCQTITPGVLGSRRRINLPGVRLSLPSLTPKDRRDIALGAALGVDFFALSFVRKPSDIEELRGILKQLRCDARIIAKIEDQQAVKNLDALIESSDGVMIARGDLGIEVPYEEMPIIQRDAVKAALRIGRPVIVATHLLESMIEHPMPTRAEITDVANAVFEQADCVMLSGETSIGKHPLESVEVLDRIARRIERDDSAGYAKAAELRDVRQKVVRSGVVMADELRATAILVFTRTGRMARFTSGLRPHFSPVFAFTESEKVRNQLAMSWGVTPFRIQFAADPETTVERAEKLLQKSNLINKGDTLVIISDILARKKLVPTVQMRKVGQSCSGASVKRRKT